MGTGSAATIDRFIDALWIEDGLAANTLSLLAMSYTLIRSHPGLRQQFEGEPLGA